MKMAEAFKLIDDFFDNMDSEELLEYTRKLGLTVTAVDDGMGGVFVQSAKDADLNFSINARQLRSVEIHLDQFTEFSFSELGVAA